MVKCVKCLVRIAVPLDGKEAIIPDDEETSLIEEDKPNEEIPKVLTLTR